MWTKISYWENKTAEKQYVSQSDTVFNNTLFSAFHSNQKHILWSGTNMIFFLSYKKIISQENFISDDEVFFTAHTTVTHSSCNTVQMLYNSEGTKQHKLSY